MTQQLMVVEDIRTRQANSARGPFEIYEIQLLGEWHRAKKPLWDSAQMLRGQTVFAETRSEQRGEWKNYYVDTLTPSSPATQQPYPATAGYPQYPPQQQIHPPQAPPAPPAPPAPEPTQKDRTIWRQTAAKVAAQMLDPGDSQLDFWANVDMLVWFFESGERPGQGEG